jgi:dephospho-CoA kinase
MIIGLTGGIASGKSTISKILNDIKIKVIDADIVAREVMDSKEVIKKVSDKFGEVVLDKNNSLDRKKLRELVFSSKERVKLLNSIVHPLVIKRFQEERVRSIETGEIVVFDIPLLFEAKMEGLCDKIIVVFVDRETQIKRVMMRDGDTREGAENILKNQMPLEEKLKNADIKIKNEGTVEFLDQTVKKIFSKLEKENSQINFME